MTADCITSNRRGNNDLAPEHHLSEPPDMPNDRRLEIKRLDPEVFEVSVNGRPPSRHTVSLTAARYQELTRGQATPEALIEYSFTFLLDREPNTSILRQFDLGVISRYFPEYPDAVRDWLAD